ncbi:hypothetical protein KBX37_28640 [Micromonospora sp. U56]|uniref:hypothetical protein n=1 Tax=Micromonospora sp. U56 TaxID=2824900 RepID=UPI001B37872B|nr:hypothetical protein [Micromonospora sp. U56]MBQ0897009.1 hypothetical protein [Micromonospora sp. U56]
MEVASSALLGRAAGLLLPKLEPLARTLISRRREREEALRLLRVDYRQDYDFVMPHSHPLLELSGNHPDDLAAFRAIADPALAYCAEHNLLEVVETLETQLERNLVVIGSPEAAPLARLAFGYRRIHSAAGFEYVGDTVDLPYRWHEDPRDLHGTCQRLVADHGWVTRPNWPLVARTDVRTTRRLAPRVDNEGKLSTDWLLISVMPNFFTRKALDEGKTIVSVGGTHGTGTRALKLFLRDPKALRQVMQSVSDRSRAFQVVVEAGDIFHKASGSAARAIRVHDVAQLPDNDDVWHTARRAVARQFSDWAAEEVTRNIPYPHERH